MAQILRPASTASAGTWTVENAATHHQALAVDSNAAWIRSGAGNLSTCRLKLDAGQTPGAGARTVYYGISRLATNRAVTLVVRLLEGTTEKGLATIVNPGTAHTTMTTGSFDVTEAISDYTDLYIEVQTTSIHAAGEGFGYYARFEIPDAAGVEPAEGTGSMSGAGTLLGIGMAIAIGVGALSGGGTLAGVGEAPAVAPAEGVGQLAGGGSMAGIGHAPGVDPPPGAGATVQRGSVSVGGVGHPQTIVTLPAPVEVGRAFPILHVRSPVTAVSTAGFRAVLQTVVDGHYTELLIVRGSELASTVAIDWQVVESPDITHAQYTWSIGSGSASAAQGITEVDLDSTFVIHTQSGGGGTPADGLARVSLSASDELLAARAGSPSNVLTITAHVVTWDGATVQSGVSAIGSSGSVSPTVSAVDPTRAFVQYSYLTTNGDSRPYNFAARGVLVDATTLTFSHHNASDAGVSVAWFLVEHPAFGVQRETVATTGTSTTKTLDPEVDPAAAFVPGVLWGNSLNSSTGANGLHRYFATHALTAADTVTVTREATDGGTMSAAVQVVEVAAGAPPDVAEGTGAITGGGDLSGVGSASARGTGAITGGGELTGTGEAPAVAPAEGTGTISGGGALSGIGEMPTIGAARREPASSPEAEPCPALAGKPPPWPWRKGSAPSPGQARSRHW
jgi:hypothetical protein